MSVRDSPEVEDSEREAFARRFAEAQVREASTPTVRMVDGRRVVWAPMPGSQTSFLQCPFFEALFHGTRGHGKGLVYQERMLTKRGWVQAAEITLDDDLMALDGTWTRVTGVYPREVQPIYRVTFTDGRYVDVDDDHKWRVLNQKTGYREGWIVRTTKQLRTFKARYNVPYLEAPADGWTSWDGPDPYMIGLLLGDGTMRSEQVTLYSGQTALIEYAIEKHGWFRYQYGDQVPRATCPKAQDDVWRAVLPRVKAPLKRVPAGLLGASADDRLALLQGLLDTDSTIEDNGKFRFGTTSKGMAEDVCELVHSLGGAAGVPRWKRVPSGYGGENSDHGYWHVAIRHNNKFAPYRLSDKAARVTTQKKFLTRGIASIERLPEDQKTICFSIAHESRCFVTAGWVVTHNSDALLMSFAQHVGKGYGAAWTGVLFRRTYPELGDIVAKTLKWFSLIFPSASFNRSEMTWRWADGETLKLRHILKPDDYWHYHGHEYPWIGFEELTTWPTSDCFTPMFSCCRSSTVGLPRMIRATTNPYGSGHSWVADRYRLKGQWWKTVVIRDARDFDGNAEPPRAAIHGHVAENKVLLDADPTYTTTISASARNPAMREAWLSGSWDVMAGGMFEDVWDRSVNIVGDFVVPRSWRIDRALDWGSSHPFAIAWFAQSDGTDLKLADGTVMPTVRGDVFCVNEWYGWTGQANSGVRMLAIDVARGIVERELSWGWRSGGRCRVHPGPADTQIWTTENGVNIAVDFRMPVKIGDRMYPGIEWTRADKRPGSRKLGWETMRRMMAASKKPPGGVREYPGFFVVGSRCPQFLRTVPSLPRDEMDLDDIPDKGIEDHYGDCVRYRLRKVGTTMRQGTTVGMN